ncbi:MAG: hypothetical protein Q8S73_25150 [Deltaproteobacteria bacterium]|nr:hypothetical protein [Deltaproteobacteria bacterium]
MECSTTRCDLACDLLRTCALFCNSMCGGCADGIDTTPTIAIPSMPVPGAMGMPVGTRAVARRDGADLRDGGWSGGR